MKKKILILGIFTVISFVLFSHKTLASTLIDSSSMGTSTLANLGSYGGAMSHWDAKFGTSTMTYTGPVWLEFYDASPVALYNTTQSYFCVSSGNVHQICDINGGKSISATGGTESYNTSTQTMTFYFPSVSVSSSQYIGIDIGTAGMSSGTDLLAVDGHGTIDNLGSGAYVYNGGFQNGCAVTVTGTLCSAIPPQTPITGSFMFPTSTYLGPDFSNWALQINGLATSTIYYLGVQYQIGSTWTLVQKIYTDQSSLNSGNATSVNWTIPKSQTLFNYQNNNTATSSWTAVLYIATSGINLTGIASSSQITFTITPNATSTPTQTGANLAGPFFFNPTQIVGTTIAQSTASSSQALFNTCPPAQDWTDIGGGLAYAGCSLINFLFTPSAAAQGYLLTQINTFENEPPVSYFTSINNALVNGAGAMTSSTEQGFNLTMFNLDKTTTSVTLVPATIAGIVNIPTDWFNYYFNFVLDAATIFFIWLLYKIVHNTLHLL